MLQFFSRLKNGNLPENVPYASVTTRHVTKYVKYVLKIIQLQETHFLNRNIQDTIQIQMYSFSKKQNPIVSSDSYTLKLPATNL